MASVRDPEKETYEDREVDGGMHILTTFGPLPAQPTTENSHNASPAIRNRMFICCIPSLFSATTDPRTPAHLTYGWVNDSDWPRTPPV